MGVGRNVSLDAAVCQEFVRVQTKIAKQVKALGVFLEDNSNTYDHDKTVTTYCVKAVVKAKKSVRTEQIASFKMRQLPGCCGVVVHFYANVSRANTALAKQLLTVREAAAKTAGYTLQLATLRADSVKELAVYEKAGWMRQQEFVNHKTNNSVVVLSKPIVHEPKQTDCSFW